LIRPAILINLKRCTGCWTCSMACKVAHQLPENKWWQYVRTIGGSNTDEPAGEWPNLHMSWLPVHTSECILCADRAKEGKDPYCVYNCPVHAMTYGDLDDPDSPIALRIRYLKNKSYRIFQLPEWEKNRKEIYYADK
jgi:Fe-S-cluster-containing dehydrogenase component